MSLLSCLINVMYLCLVKVLNTKKNLTIPPNFQTLVYITHPYQTNLKSPYLDCPASKRHIQ